MRERRKKEEVWANDAAEARALCFRCGKCCVVSSIGAPRKEPEEVRRG